MIIKCSCNTPMIYTKPIGRVEYRDILNHYFYSQSKLECFSCHWQSKEIKEYDTGNPYTLIGKILCKITEHTEFELVLKDKGIKYVCKRCGFTINDIDKYNRLQKIKKLKNF